MNIKGSKITLRAIEESDGELLLNMMNDPDIEYMIGGWSFPISQRSQREWLSKIGGEKDVLRCIVENEEHTAVGAAMLTSIDFKNGNAELHIKLAKQEDRSKGIGTDVMQTAVKYAFDELRLKCVYGRINDYNLASQRILDKCGFEKEGVLRSRIYKKGSYHDMLVYSIIKD